MACHATVEGDHDDLGIPVGESLLGANDLLHDEGTPVRQCA